MKSKVLITGGAGFIGSHLADELLVRGYSIRVLDNLSEHVHGPEASRPAYLNEDVELLIGDLNDASVVATSLKGVDVVIHLSPATLGAGSSDVLANCLAEAPVGKLIVGSRITVYGEGLYKNAAGEMIDSPARAESDLARGLWEVRGADGTLLEPVPTTESSAVSPISLTARAKYDTEVRCCEVGSRAGIPTTILRFSSVFGTRQPTLKSNPGVVTHIARQILSATPPLIFEDGGQTRDLVSVYDVTEALALALESDAAAGEIFNIASGTAYSVLEVAQRLGTALGRVLEPEVTGTYRIGDVRHSIADITKAQTILGYRPEVSLEDGFAELAEWMRNDTNAAGLKNDVADGIGAVAPVPVPAV